MARTNIEDTGFTKALELAHAMSWTPTEALGALGWLWHESQAKVRLSGSAKEISRWSKLPANSDAQEYIDTLLELELIRELTVVGHSQDEREYEIAGNDDEVKRLVALKERSKKGGESTRRKWDEEQKRVQNKATSRPAARPTGPAVARPTATLVLGTDQIRSDQCSSDQIRTEQCKENTGTLSLSLPPSKYSDLGNKTQALIAAYCEAYKARYRINPIIDGKAQGAARSLAKMGISEDRKLSLIEAYLVMNDPWFITRRHDLPTLLANLNAVNLKVDTGFAPTRLEIQKIDQKQTVLNAFGPLIAEAEAREAEETRNVRS